MDPQFRRMLIIVITMGTLMLGGGGTLLFLAFRAFGEEKQGSLKPLLFAAAMLAVIFVSCIILFVLSFK